MTMSASESLKLEHDRCLMLEQALAADVIQELEATPVAEFAQQAIDHVVTKSFLLATGASPDNRKYPLIQGQFACNVPSDPLIASGAFDSMAGENILSRNLLHAIEAKLGRPLPRLPPRNAFYTCGGNVSSECQVALTFQLRDNEGLYHTFTDEVFDVLPEPPIPFLLGNRFHLEHDLSITWKEGTLTTHFGHENFTIDHGEVGAEQIPNVIMYTPVAPTATPTDPISSKTEGPPVFGIWLPNAPPELTHTDDPTSACPARLNPQDKATFDKLLDDNKDLFTPLAGVPPVRDGVKEVEQVLRDPNSTPVWRPPFPQDAEKKEAMRVHIKELEAIGLMSSAPNSKWASPMFMVGKQDSAGRFTGWRAVFDYRGVNALCSTYQYPLPKIPDLLAQAATGNFFSSIDLTSGFYQLRLSDKSKEISTVSTPWGLYSWNVAPMGLSSVPAYFQEFIDKVLVNLPFCLGYIDDVLVYSTTVTQHLQHLHQFFIRARELKLHLKPQKCSWFCKALPWLGYRLSPGAINMLPKNSSTMLSEPRPETREDLTRFLGRLNYYRAFIRQFSGTAAPLYEQLKGPGKGRDKILWSDPCKEAYTSLLSTIKDNPTLHTFRPDLPIRVKTDACSGVGLGAVLEQDHGLDPNQSHSDKQGRGISKWAPVEFFSRRWVGGELHAKVHELELVAIIESLEHWAHLLQGKEVHVLTDNSAVVYYTTKSLNKFSNKELRLLTRWAPFSSTCRISHIPGHLNHMADSLSRHPDGEKCVWEIVDYFAGSPSLLRAIECLWNTGQLQCTRIRYNAIESNAYSRAQILAVHQQMLKRGVPLSENPFELGDACCHGVDTLAAIIKEKNGHEQLAIVESAHLSVAGPPCQGVSSAGKGKGMAHPGDGWNALMRLHPHIKGQFYYENVPGLLTDLHENLKDLLVETFGIEPQLHRCHGPQARHRIIFTQGAHVPQWDTNHYTKQLEIWGLPRTWQEALNDAANADGQRLPATAPTTYCPTLMTKWPSTYSERDGKALVLDPATNQPRMMTSGERERLVGLNIGDTGKDPVLSKRLTGNAIPVPFLTLLLRLNAPCRPQQAHISVDHGKEHSCHTSPSPLTTQVNNSAEHLATPPGLSPTPLLATPAMPPSSVPSSGEHTTSSSAKHVPLNHQGALEDITDLAQRLQIVHETYGHPGASRTATLLARLEHRLPSKEDLLIAASIVKNCQFCARWKQRTHPGYRKHQLPLPDVLESFHEISIDECSGLRMSAQGHDSFLTIVDRLTGFIIAVPMAIKSTSQEMAQRLFQTLSPFGLPTKVRCDKGPRFLGDFTKLCEARGIQVAHSVAHRHEHNGLSERAHQSLIKAMKALNHNHAQVHKYMDPAQWEESLAEATILCNNYPKPSLAGFSSAEMLLGRTIHHKPQEESRADSWARWKTLVQDIVKKNHATIEGDLLLDSTSAEAIPTYTIGERVLLHVQDLDAPRSNKLQSPWVPGLIKNIDQRTKHSVPRYTITIGSRTYESGPDRIRPLQSTLQSPINGWATPSEILNDALEYHAVKHDVEDPQWTHDLCGSCLQNVCKTYFTNVLQGLSSSAFDSDSLLWCNPPWNPTAEALHLLQRIIAKLRSRNLASQTYFCLPRRLFKKMAHHFQPIRCYSSGSIKFTSEHGVALPSREEVILCLCLPTPRSPDKSFDNAWWHDHCHYCQQGGLVHMCTKCPRVFHQHCLPSSAKPQAPNWTCGLCHIDHEMTIDHYLLFEPSQKRIWVRLTTGDYQWIPLRELNILALREYAAFCNEPWGLAIRKPTSKAQKATVAGLGIPDTHLHLYSRKGPPDHELALNVHAKEGENAINESETHLWLKLLH